jgi:hypothetical protein
MPREKRDPLPDDPADWPAMVCLPPLAARLHISERTLRFWCHKRWVAGATRRNGSDDKGEWTIPVESARALLGRASYLARRSA